MENRERRFPALRAKVGVWIYYVSTMSFSDIAKLVSPINDELHKSTLLSEMIQRSITENYKDIANYLITQEERFFNALILAVYNGEPKWNEIRIDDIDSTDEYGLGILSLDGNEKIFPVDGQHRVEGIKTALDSNPELAGERVPVVFVGHSIDDVGMQRTRRLFSTLNRYAKPVSLRDIIALDEDDVVAIASRKLIDEKKMFKEDQILDSKNKAVPETNRKALTSIIAYYECNRELLWLRIKEREIICVDEKRVKGRSKINEFIKHRPEEEFIELFTLDCQEYWDAILQKCSAAFEGEDIGEFRSRNGGHIFFRPAALIPFTKAYVRAKIDDPNLQTYQLIEKIPDNLVWIQDDFWKKILWDDVKCEMIVGNAKLVELLFVYVYKKNLLTQSEIRKICKEFRAIYESKKRDTDEDIINYIKQMIESTES